MKTVRSSACENGLEVELFKAYRRTRQKDSEVRKLVKHAIEEVRVCAQLTEADVLGIIEAMQYFVFDTGHEIQRPGEPTELFIVVQEGSLKVRVEDEVVDTVTAGSAFGAEGLLYGCPRTTKVTTEEATGIWGASGSTFQQVLRERARANCTEYRKFLASMSVFAGLPARQMDLLSQALFEEAYPPDAKVVSKGDNNQTLYCVKTGMLRVVEPAENGRPAQDLTQLQPGDCFGERALLYGERRAATVIAVGRCELLCIGASQLRSVLGTDLHAYLERSVVLTGLRGAPAYSQFGSAQLSALVQAMEMKDCEAGKPLGDVLSGGARAVIVVEGLIEHPGACGQDPVTVSRGVCCEADSSGFVMAQDAAQSPVQRHSSSSSEVSLRLGDFTAGEGGARISILSQDGLVFALGRRLSAASAEQASEYAGKMLLVRKVPCFRHLNQEQTNSVVSALRLKHYSQEELVIKQGSLGDSMFVISRGEVSIYINDRLIRTQGRNACFGERALLFDERRTATVKVSSAHAEIWTIDKATFGEIIKGKMQEDLIRRIQLQDTQVTLQDLRPVKVIGTGAFSVVRLVEHKRTGVRYALKSVKKQHGKIPADMVNECSILLENDHPFILYVVKTFETELRVCMLTELITGGDLHGAIRQIPTVLSRKQAQFYVGSLVIAIEALWDRNIVYRDLKPENVMLDAQGYLKIIDFGISKKLQDSESRTFTTVGTPHYMAPEVMQGRGYGIEVDLWSLGIMLFEFVCGYLPFADDLDEPAEVCAAVLTQKLQFPRAYRDGSGKDLIAGLLCRWPERRLGAGSNGCADVKAAPFFRLERGDPHQLFDKIMGRELDPPLVPCGETYCEDEEVEAAERLSDAEDLFEEASPRTSNSPRCLAFLNPCRRTD